jgi:hypothetical protein
MPFALYLPVPLSADRVPDRAAAVGTGMAWAPCRFFLGVYNLSCIANIIANAGLKEANE